MLLQRTGCHFSGKSFLHDTWRIKSTLAYKVLNFGKHYFEHSLNAIKNTYILWVESSDKHLHEINSLDGP